MTVFEHDAAPGGFECDLTKEPPSTDVALNHMDDSSASVDDLHVVRSIPRRQQPPHLPIMTDSPFGNPIGRPGVQDNASRRDPPISSSRCSAAAAPTVATRSNPLHGRNSGLFRNGSVHREEGANIPAKPERRDSKP